MGWFDKFLVFGIILILLIPLSSAETTCETNNCNIKITLKLAFSGATDDYINRVEQEIENTWNGPDGFRTTGDCKCKMTFEVETMKITNASQVNCNPGPPGYHCIMVTPYFKPNGQYDNPPRNQTNITGATIYLGYMYGIATGDGGNSQKGWWSDLMSRPVNANDPNGEHYKDFAHEAGHMMGLEDGDGGIMSRTSGANSDPTQANIDEIANDICGANACPDNCCCGNGEVENGKGEQCDPFASPDGCGVGQACCPVCCSCYGPICIAANGEYLGQTACQAACGTDAQCYKNYKTGCWDCVKNNVVIEKTCSDPNNIRGNGDCDHTVYSFIDHGVGFYDNLAAAPVIGGLFSDEKINIQTDEGDVGHIATEASDVTDYGETLTQEPTVTIYTDRETVGLLASEDLSVQQALSEGMIRIEGEGLVNGFKFGVYHFFFDVYNFLNPAEEFTGPEEEGLPQEYYDIISEATEAEPAADDPNPEDIGELPDGGHIGSDVLPS
ncbi:hypothetical protein KKB44_01155 [Candidatus Micrarchaeota archaeon]|nr:hypothetical protein [Candidatus Micrarchaeota archaeon]